MQVRVWQLEGDRDAALLCEVPVEVGKEVNRLVFLLANSLPVLDIDELNILFSCASVTGKVRVMSPRSIADVSTSIWNSLGGQSRYRAQAR